MGAAVETHALTKEFVARVREAGLKAAFGSLVKAEYKHVLAVDGVEFSVDQGDMLAFIGPNGAGKSTTIKMLTGILHPSSGSASVLGHNPTTERLALARKIGTVFGQKSQLWMHLPPMDSFLLLGAIYDIEKESLRKRVDELTDRFSLGSLLKTPVRKLSLGQRVRCEVAATLLHQPEILFLDEPTIGLDVIVKREIRELIRSMNKERGTTVFLTSHDAGDVEQLCRRAIVIDHGKIVLDEPVKKLKHDYLSRKVISVRFNEPQTLTPPIGVALEKGTAYAARLNVDTRAVSIDEALRYVTQQGGVADITVEDPPMEEVIEAIFRGKSGGESA